MQDKRKTKKNQCGIALILVLGILAVLVTLATTFAFNMRLEQKAARNYLDTVTVDCIARIGVEYAIALLRNDVTDEPAGTCEGYDWNGDNWGYWQPLPAGPGIFGAEGGTDQNLDDYEPTESDDNYGADARWKGVWQDEVLVGRYAVLVIDEASKMNINCAGNATDPHISNEGWTTSEMDLGKLPDITAPIAVNIVNYRYGFDNGPGDNSIDDDEDSDAILECDGIDNNAVGGPDEGDEGTDEPDEYTPWYPRGDDEAFSTIRQIRLEPTITPTIWGKVKNLITVHSRTRNQYWDGSDWQDKVNINAVAEVNEIYMILDGVEVLSPRQKACNIMDYRDDNFVISALRNIYTGVWIYGVEPILINEVLGKSYKDDTSYTGTENGTSSPPVVYTGLAPNTCYRVTIDTSTYDPTPGEYTVKIGSTTEPVNADPYDFTSLSDCISDASGQLSITFEDTNLDAEVSTVTNVYFTCAEFIELCNIGDENIDIVTAPAWEINVGSGYVSIPAGKISGTTTNNITSKSYFILTNDEELFDYSYGNKSGTWGDHADENVPVADIGGWTDGYATQGELAESGEDILLRNQDDLFVERAVTADENSSNYGNSSGIGVSREKDDPTMRADWGDSTHAIFESSAIYMNDRASGHTLSDIGIKNHPFASIGEMADTTNYYGVGSGDEDWDGAINNGAISGGSSASDLGKFAERITVDAVRLDAETTISITDTDADSTGGKWDTAAAFPAVYSHYPTECCVSSSGISETSYWAWTSARLQPVPHILYIYGVYTNDSDDNYLNIRIWNYVNDTWDTQITGFEYGPSDGLEYGTISTSNISPNGSFKIELETENTTTHDVYFDYLLLVPESMPGKINLNTAWVDVLAGLPGISVAEAQDIYDNTPYTKLGDVLDYVTAAQFAPISNLVSVHSDCFQIICLAQAIKDIDGDDIAGDADDLILAEKKVRVIVDRSSLDLTSGAIKVLYWEEMRD